MAIPYLQYGQDGLSGYDSQGVRRIWLDPSQLLMSFFDTDGVTPRCEIGNLPSRGVSPAHWGFRVNSASGAPIYDSQGLIQHTTLLASGSVAPSPVVGTVADQVIISRTFTLTRTQTVRLEGLCNGLVTWTGPGPFFSAADVYLQVTGQSASTSQALPQVLNSFANATMGSATVLQILQLPAGTYTANFYWKAINGTNDTLQVPSFSIFVFLLGG